MSTGITPRQSATRHQCVSNLSPAVSPSFYQLLLRKLYLHFFYSLLLDKPFSPLLSPSSVDASIFPRGCPLLCTCKVFQHRNAPATGLPSIGISLTSCQRICLSEEQIIYIVIRFCIAWSQLNIPIGKIRSSSARLPPRGMFSFLRPKLRVA